MDQRNNRLRFGLHLGIVLRVDMFLPYMYYIILMLILQSVRNDSIALQH